MANQRNNGCIMIKKQTVVNIKVIAIVGVAGLAVGCASQSHVKVHTTGDPIADGRASMHSAPAKDKVLWQYRIAASAMRLGRYEDAKLELDGALMRINGIMGPDKTAEEARSMFKAEAKKTFIGEPYERVMANYYRGILYWMDGDADNARACFVNGQFLDSDAGQFHENSKTDKSEADKFASDYVLLDYLDGLIKFRSGGDGDDAFKRAIERCPYKSLPPYDKEANVFVFAEFGKGPTKYATGQYKQELRFKPGGSQVSEARLKVNGQTHRLPPYDDINFQAVTRGGRVMDHILNNKAVFKDTTSAVGDAALVAGAVTASTSSYAGSDVGAYAGVGMMAFGLLSKMVSTAANPAADVRCWDNLPAHLSFASLTLAPGEYPATVEFLDETETPYIIKDIVIKVADGGKQTVVFVSDQER